MKLNDEQAASIVEGLRAWKQGGYKDGLQLLPDGNVAGTCSTEEMMFFAALTKMATWALEHPSKSKFQYISHDNVRANESLTTAFRHWWYAEHPHYTAAQHKMFEESVNHGKCPDAVMEHTPDGHHPIGWSWGSEFVLADFYLCLTRTHLINISEPVFCDTGDAQGVSAGIDGEPLGTDRRTVGIGGTFAAPSAA